MPISDRLLVEISENWFTDSELDFSGSVVESRGVKDEDVYELVEALRSNTHIKSIKLNNTEVGDKSAKILSTINTLEKIDLSSTNVTSEGVKALLKSRAYHLSLHGLDLTDDCLEGIESNNTIKILWLGSNHIALEGVKLISQNKTLEWVDLGMNLTINDECAPYFASMKSLKRLTLVNNLLTIKGAKILKESSIGDLFLKYNHFDYEEFLALPSEKPKYIALPFPAFEASKKPRDPEIKEKAEAEEAEKEVGPSSKKLKS